TLSGALDIGPVTVNAGTLKFSETGPNVAFIGTLASSSSTSSVVLAGTGLDIGTDSNASATFAGVISGTGMLLKVDGTETLSGQNPYTGKKKIEKISLAPATLALTGSGSISSSSAVEIEQGGTFDISGTTSGTTITTLQGASGGTVNLGARTLGFSNA